jgi:hypothetical protein
VAVLNRLARRGNTGHGGGSNYGHGSSNYGHGQSYGKQDFSTVKKFGGQFNGIKKDGKAASLPPSLKNHDVAMAVKPTGNYKADIKATRLEAKEHRTEADTAYKQGRLANKLDAKKYPSDAKFDAKADKKWSSFQKADRLRDQKSIDAGIAKIKKVDLGGKGGYNSGYGSSSHHH